MNAKEFCKAVVNWWEQENGNPISDVAVVQFGSVGIAMEHLGLIKNEETKEYISTRDGIGASQLLHLIPETERNSVVEKFGESPTMREILEFLG